MTGLCTLVALVCGWRGFVPYGRLVILIGAGCLLGIAWLVVAGVTLARRRRASGPVAWAWFPAAIAVSVTAIGTDLVLVTRIRLSEPSLDRAAEEALRTWPAGELRRFSRAGLVWSSHARIEDRCLYVVTQRPVGVLGRNGRGGGIAYVAHGAPRRVGEHLTGRWWKFTPGFD